MGYQNKLSANIFPTFARQNKMREGNNKTIMGTQSRMTGEETRRDRRTDGRAMLSKRNV